eukprot:1145545-Pelagomonas_calceolata.AAC.6
MNSMGNIVPLGHQNDVMECFTSRLILARVTGASYPSAKESKIKELKLQSCPSATKKKQGTRGDQFFKAAIWGKPMQGACGRHPFWAGKIPQTKSSFLQIMN